MNLITDRQITWNGGPFPKGYDTVKVFEEGRKFYKHGDETFATKSALRRALSSEYGGAWIEEKSGKKQYFIDESGWLQRSIREVSKEEFAKRLESPSTWEKVLGIGLGILALAPGAIEFARHIPIGAKEVGMGLLALQQKRPLLGVVGFSCLPSTADAQAMGTEFQVNTYTTSYQDSSSVAPLNDGGFVVSWESSGQDGDQGGIYGQRYIANGAQAGGEFQVNTYTTNNQWYPNIAPLNDGGFVVTWQSFGQDGNGYGIFGQMYNVTGVRAGTEFQVNTYTASDQTRSCLAPLNDGGFVVIWQSDGQDGDLTGIFGQRYNASGASAGTEFQVNTYTTGDQQYPSIAPLNDGGFIVIWQSDGQDGDLAGILGQRYNASGTSTGTEFQINTYTTSDQERPSVAPLNDGGFVVTWESNGQDGDGYGIFGQRYNATGAQAGTEFQVNTYTISTQWFSSVAPLNDGGFVITWESRDHPGDNYYGIDGQRYNATGARAGTEFQVNTYTTSWQLNPSVAPLNDGGFVVVWDSSGQDGSSWGIYGQRYDSNGNPVGLTVQIQRSGFPSQTSTSAFQSNLSPSPSQVTIDSSPSLSASRISTQSNPTSTQNLLTRTRPSTSGTTALSSNLNQSQPYTFSQSRMPASSGIIIYLVIDIVYGESYPIYANGEIVGTYTISGGTGLLNSDNPNVITMHFNSSYSPEEGEIIPLFSIPPGQTTDWQSIQLQESTFECLVAREEIVSGSAGSNYQLSFDFVPNCASNAPQILISVIAIITN